MSERRPSVVVVSAPSGAGKSTVLAPRAARAAGPALLGVAHDPPPRGRASATGVEYHFVERAAFEAPARPGALLESAEVHGNLYGTSRGRDRAGRARGRRPRCSTSTCRARRRCAQRIRGRGGVFILPPSYEELERRLRGRGAGRRGDDPPAPARRPADEIDAFETYDYVIVNDDLDALRRGAEEHRAGRALPREPHGANGRASDRDDFRVGKGDRTA